MDDSTVPDITVAVAATDSLMVNRQKGIRDSEQAFFDNSVLNKVFFLIRQKAFHSNLSVNSVLVDLQLFTKVSFTALNEPSKLYL